MTQDNFGLYPSEDGFLFIKIITIIIDSKCNEYT